MADVTYYCPECGGFDFLHTIETTEAYSQLEPNGEHNGYTDYDGDLCTVGIGCGKCGWLQYDDNGDREWLLQTYLKTEPPSVEKLRAMVAK